MTNFPSDFDDDITLPPVNDNITEIGEEAINALRSAMFAVEAEIGIGASGSMGSIADRLAVSIDNDGTILPSAITGLGLVTLPITNNQISAIAAIEESKLSLTYSTQSLYNLIQILDNAVAILEGFNSITGIKIQPHISGVNYRHLLSHIDVDPGTWQRVNISTGTIVNRDTTNSNTLVNELSDDLLNHTRATGTSDKETPPENFAHNASGLYIDTSNFASIPQTQDSLQSFAEYVDQSSLTLLGSRTQNLYANGVPRSMRGFGFLNSSAGEPLVPETDATTYLLDSGSTFPVDDIASGDDVILLTPSGTPLSSYLFDAQFSKVKQGDYITVNYNNDTAIVTFAIDSVKTLINGSSRIYAVRIAGKNLFATTSASVKIDRPFYHDNRFGQLAIAAANNNFSETPSLIAVNPRSASVVGVGFNANKIDQTHYNLYIALYPTGDPVEKTYLLKAIDVSGNQGTTPGQYTLDSIVDATNNAFRKKGFNYRFLAFSYQGEFGLALSDHFNNASFSIIAGAPDGYGNYTIASNAPYVNNVISVYDGMDALGLGPGYANVAGPAYAVSYSSAFGARASTFIHAPLKKSFFYVDGVERDTLGTEIETENDDYGDKYWPATIVSRQAFIDRVEVTYEIDLDLEESGLQVGKTLVVQPAFPVSSGSYTGVDYGRFIISGVTFINCPGPTGTTSITVYDAVHGTGVSPYASSENIPVRIYFSDDSIGFNNEHVSDTDPVQVYKRYFEVFVDSKGNSFTHERARIGISGDITIDSTNSFTLYNSTELSAFNLYNVSPKLRGYSYYQYNKITLFINNYDETSGIYDGYLCKFDYPSTYSHIGNTVTGKLGEITRFYDESNVDYIDVVIDINTAVSSFSNKKIDIQLFGSLVPNQEYMFLGTCQLNDLTNKITYVKDGREFGNVSEKQLSTSALNFISASDRLLKENGIVRGFDYVSTSSNKISIKGGQALIDGKIVSINDSIAVVPNLIENIGPDVDQNLNIRWFLCANSKGELEFIASTDYNASTESGLYGSFDHNRIYYAKSGSTTYPIRSGFYQKIIKDYKDVIPLFYIFAVYNSTPELSSITIVDLRKFSSNGYSGIGNAPVLGPNGNFRSFEAATTHLQQLANYKSFSADKVNEIGFTIVVKGEVDISSNSFSYNTPVKFIGDGGKMLISSQATLIKNVEFENITFDISSATGFYLDNLQNVSFKNCTFNYLYDASADMAYDTNLLINTGFGCIYTDIANISMLNFSVKDCIFNIDNADHYSVINFEMGDDVSFQNIQITDNKFNQNFGGNDYKGVVTILGYSLISSTTAPILINCNISNNTCKTQQLIMVSSYNGTDNVNNMIIAANVNIENNICGAIGYITRSPVEVSQSIYTDMLFIYNNTCAFIYSGFGSGYIDTLDGYQNASGIVSGQGIYSGSVKIEDNKCSWIHVGIKIPDSGGVDIPTLDIINNKLKPSLLSILDKYYLTLASDNTAIIVNEVSGN